MLQRQRTHLADGYNLRGEGVLVVVAGILLVVADQLLVCAVAHGHYALQEVQEPLSMTTLAEEEVYTLQQQETAEHGCACSRRSPPLTATDSAEYGCSC